MSVLGLTEYYQFPDSVKTEFKVIPWLQLLVYLPFFFEPFILENLAIVFACHLVIFALSFKVYWLEDSRVLWLFLLALLLSFFTSFYSLSSIVLYAITILIAMAHSRFRARLVMVFIVVGCYLLSAWIQAYSLVILLIGLFLTLVNGISVCYQIKALYQQLAVKQSQEEVRLTATSTERERIAHDLHDVLGQSLTGISLKAELAIRTFDQTPEVARQQLTEIIAISRNTLKEVRAAVADYRQTSIENEIISARVGFGAVGIKFECDLVAIAITPEIEQALAWIIREATTNVMRHSKASLCQISLKKSVNMLTLIITDNGSGEEDNNKQPEVTMGTGMMSIRQRCQAINASFSLSQAKGYTLTIAKEVL